MTRYLPIKFGLGVRIAASISALVACVVMFALISVSSARYGSEQLARVLSAGELKNSLRQTQEVIVRFVAFAQLIGQGDASFGESLSKYAAEMDGQLAQLEQLMVLMPASAWGDWKQMQQDWQKCRKIGLQLASGVTDAYSGRIAAVDDVRALCLGIQGKIRELTDASEDYLKNQSSEAGDWQKRFRKYVSLIGFCVALFGIGIGAFLLIVLLRPFRRLGRIRKIKKHKSHS
jgi:hypothetical protein